MTYIKNDIYKKAKAAIKKHHLYFIEDVVAMLPCRKQTFYEIFPLQSDEMDTIKELLDQEKITKKVEIRQKLSEGRNIELIALYKLICTDDERRALSMQQIEHSGKLQNINIEVSSEAGAKALKEYLDETETD